MRTAANELKQEEMFEGVDYVTGPLAITGMRDSGYKNTAYALAELIDNAQQAEASSVELLCLERRERVNQRERFRISKIGVLDNGTGMDQATLHVALQFGNGKYLNDRSGIGRFGMGLPNASISQSKRVDVWSWQNGPDNALHTHLDVDEIVTSGNQSIPRPAHSPVPAEWRALSEDYGKSGTLVVWSKLEIHRLTWKSAKATLANTERLVGRIYRRFITDGSFSIRLFAQQESGEAVYDRVAVVDDPLHLTPSELVPKPFDQEPMFEPAFEEDHEIEYGGSTHTVHVRYSVARSKTVEIAGTRNRGKTPWGKHAAKNMGVSVIRAGRELMLDQGWCIGYDPRERWWGAELEFPPALDELFGVTNNKQGATHFAELASIDHEHLTEDGDENFRDVVNRLQREGDPRGYLLPLADSINRNLGQLRTLIKAQAPRTGGDPKQRHPDPLVDELDILWKKRSEERPIEGENQPRTDEDYREIKKDLTENKQYPEPEAEALVSLIRQSDFSMVFLEADFPNAYQLFDVEMKGNVTEITFNRKHPAFDDIFRTVNTADEDVEDLTREEILERLTRGVNSSKIIFAAWARYEREAGVEQARKLAKVRYDWGQIAAGFLEPDDDLAL